MKIIKNIVMYILIFVPVAKGFSVSGAKQWMRKIFRNLMKDKEHSLREKIWAYRRGFMPDYVSRFDLKSYDKEQYISERDYRYVQPINGIYRKWLADKGVSRKVFAKYSQYIPELYYQITVVKGKRQVVMLDDCPYDTKSESDVARLIREKGTLVVTEPRGTDNVMLSYRDEAYYFDEEKFSDEETLMRRIAAYNGQAIIAEYVRPAEDYSNNNSPFGNLLRLTVCNDKGYSPEITEAFLRIDDYYTDGKKNLEREINEFYNVNYSFNDYASVVMSSEDEEFVDESEYYEGIIARVDVATGEFSGGKIMMGDNYVDCDINFRTNEVISGKIRGYDEIKKTVETISKHTPQLEFFAVDILITEDGFKLMGFANVPKYPTLRMFNEETARFLNKKLREKKQLYKGFKVRVDRGTKRIRLKTRRLFAAAFFPKGLLPYLSLRWMKEVIIDFFTNRDTSLATKIWAYRHGFLSYRIPQYGITKENHLNYISDFEYKWLRHINGRYRVLFEDKITIKYIISGFKDCFPEYYYHIKTDNDANIIIPMMDCPEGYDNTIEDILALAKEKKVLALKPDEGSHGDGFYKLSYEDDKYHLNFDEATEQDVIDILMNPDNQYLVTEYINNHPQFKAIYDGAVNTIRMIVFKKDGKTPQIGNAYMRFGSKATGAVDNMGAGGMFVQVDVDTGRYDNAKIITHNSIQDCPNHPDTGVLIEGTIPHWEQVKQTVLEVASSIHQLEYFGFDIAVTEEGIKFPEINRFPDYPKIEKLSPLTMDYLLYKLEQKKKLYGYDKKPCRKLVHLPKR